MTEASVSGRAMANARARAQAAAFAGLKDPHLLVVRPQRHRAVAVRQQRPPPVRRVRQILQGNAPAVDRPNKLCKKGCAMAGRQRS